MKSNVAAGSVVNVFMLEFFRPVWRSIEKEDDDVIRTLNDTKRRHTSDEILLPRT